MMFPMYITAGNRMKNNSERGLCKGFMDFIKVKLAPNGDVQYVIFIG